MTEKPKGFKQKWENYWYHHKFETLIALFFVASALVLGIDVAQKKDPDMVIAYVSEAYGDEMQFRHVEDSFRHIVGDINGDGFEKINYRFMVIRKTFMDSYSLSQEQHFNYSFLDKDVRLYIIEEKFFGEKALYFEPLEDLVPADVLEGGLRNAEGEICAVPLLSCALAADMDCAREELYVALKRKMDTEKHDKLVPLQQEKAFSLLRYIIEGEPA